MLKKIHTKFFCYAVIAGLIIFSFPVGKPVLADYGVQTKTKNCISNQVLSDSGCTPGAVLTTDTAIICKVGYTKTVRDVPVSVKKQVFAEYGIAYSQRAKYEVDHLISLELGGSNDISNLWPENSNIKNGSLIKDKFENYLHKQACSNAMTIQEAQAEISGNWLQYYQATLIPAKPKSTTIIPAPVPSPTPKTPTKPAGATAKCRDGTYSYSTSKSGTCSHHGGVQEWY